MRYIAGMIIGLLFAAVHFSQGANATDSTPPPRHTNVQQPYAGPTNLNWQTRQCKVEDGANCWWDGGNHSFYSIKMQHRVCIAFWNKAYAVNHNRCYKI